MPLDRQLCRKSFFDLFLFPRTDEYADNLLRKQRKQDVGSQREDVSTLTNGILGSLNCAVKIICTSATINGDPYFNRPAPCEDRWLG